MPAHPADGGDRARTARPRRPRAGSSSPVASSPAWRASTAHSAAEPLPAALAEIARTLLALHDIDEIVAALDLAPHVLDVGVADEPTLPTSSFVALPTLAATAAGATVPDELVIESTDGTVIRVRGRVDAVTLAAIVRDTRAPSGSGSPGSLR